MLKKYLGLRGLLWFICVYHVTAGVLLNSPKEWIAAVAKWSFGNMTLTGDPGMYFFLRPLGVYLIIFGIMMGIAAWNPMKNRALITVGVILFALRIVQRIMTAGEFQSLFGLSQARNTVMILIVAVFGVALAWFRFQLYRDMHGGTPPSSADA